MGAFSDLMPPNPTAAVCTVVNLSVISIPGSRVTKLHACVCWTKMNKCITTEKTVNLDSVSCQLHRGFAADVRDTQPSSKPPSQPESADLLPPHHTQGARCSTHHSEPLSWATAHISWVIDNWKANQQQKRWMLHTDCALPLTVNREYFALRYLTGRDWISSSW